MSDIHKIFAFSVAEEVKKEIFPSVQTSFNDELQQTIWVGENSSIQAVECTPAPYSYLECSTTLVMGIPPVFLPDCEVDGTGQGSWNTCYE